MMRGSRSHCAWPARELRQLHPMSQALHLKIRSSVPPGSDLIASRVLRADC
jgi:hypothetical protein